MLANGVYCDGDSKIKDVAKKKRSTYVAYTTSKNKEMFTYRELIEKSKACICPIDINDKKYSNPIIDRLALVKETVNGEVALSATKEEIESKNVNFFERITGEDSKEYQPINSGKPKINLFNIFTNRKK